jgi:zinc transport system permease protein
VSTLSFYDPLFRVPFITGLLFAAVLPLLGMYLRLREEWLAALAFAQVAAAGALGAAIQGLPVPLGSFGAAGAAAAAKSWLFRSGNNGYALLMVAGWGAAILMLANAPMADQLGNALFDGQLYFAGVEHLWGAAAFSLIALGVLRWLSRRLLLEHMFPDFFRASGQSARRYHLSFDLLVATGIALATASIGVMAAFSLVFAPSMVAWQWGKSWKFALGVSVVSGLASYVVAFELALRLDQPFGPVLALCLVSAAVISGVARWALRHSSWRFVPNR